MRNRNVIMCTKKGWIFNQGHVTILLWILRGSQPHCTSSFPCSLHSHPHTFLLEAGSQAASSAEVLCSKPGLLVILQCRAQMMIPQANPPLMFPLNSEILPKFSIIYLPNDIIKPCLLSYRLGFMRSGIVLVCSAMLP